MILNALVDRYDALAADNAKDMPASGWAAVEAALCAELNADGTVAGFADLRDDNGKDRKTVAPEFIPHNNPPTPNVFYDTAPYALGAGIYKGEKGDEKNGSPDPAARSGGAEARDLFHRHFRPRNLEVIPPDADDPLLRAFRAFLESWNPESVREILPNSEGNLKWKEFGARKVVFRLADGPPDEFLHRRDGPAAALYEKWREQQRPRAANSAAEGVCMITGRRGPIAVSHSKILQDAYLVSFGKGNPAFASHGWSQGWNAPVGEEAAHKYKTALRRMLDENSGQVVHSQDTSIVFWTKKPGDDEKEIVEAVRGPARRISEERNKWARRLAAFLKEWRKANKADAPEMDIPFFILGLSRANKARLSVRLWLETTLGGMRKNVADFYDETRTGTDESGRLPPLALLRGLNTAFEDDKEKGQAVVHEKLKGEFFSAVLSGGKYPAQLLALAVARFRVDRPLNDERPSEYAFRDREKSRAALVQAFLIRNHNRKELAPMKKESALNPGHESAAYQLGRLFAVLEKIQSDALGSVNATIRDRFIGGVLSHPGHVFPVLMRGAQHHLRSLRSREGIRVPHEKRLEEIHNRVRDGMPQTMSLEQQGLFFLGYYHQRQNLWTKSDAAAETENTDDIFNTADAEQE